MSAKKNSPVRLLPMIKAGPPMTSLAMAEKLGASPRKVKAALTRLHKRGLIRRMKVDGHFCYVPVEFEITVEGLVQSVLDRSVEEGDCRLWTKAKDRQGNPLMRHGDNQHRVQNVIWKAAGNELPATHRLIMKCKNKDCILLEHMVRVDRTVPFKIAAAEGKWSGPARAAKLAKSARERIGMFEPDDIIKIRASELTNVELANEYGCNKSSIAQIRRHLTYKDYSSPFAGLGAR